VTLSALLATVRKSLRSFGLANPDVEAEIVISHVLGLKRSEIYLEPARTVAPADQDRIAGIVDARRRRFPLQYLIGEIEFMGLPFRMHEGVFIPRPETEILVETVIDRARGIAGARAGGEPARGGQPARAGQPATGRQPASGGARLTILDLATGSGAIAVSLAKYLPCDLVLATDLSPEAAGLARANAYANGVGETVAVAVGSGLDFLGRIARPAPGWNGVRSSGKRGRGGGGDGGARRAVPGFDVVVSNPPYIPTCEIGALQPEVRDYEPRLALDGGDDGLSFIAGVVPEIPSILKVGSVVAFEIGAGQGSAVRGIFERAGLGGVEVIKDLAGRDRIVIGTWHGSSGS
jgi:release factor glutamine methyltransferase